MNPERFMARCIELALRGAGHVAPNPMVGAVLVHEGRIIGEGWHRQYGHAHAEVNCIRQAIDFGEGDKIASSTLYVSLEPCAHTGKTPPCTDLIIQHQIPEVVIGCTDTFDAVNGKGIEKLKAAGVKTTVGIMEAECRELNKRFFTFHEKKRPFIILKWAETADGMIGSGVEDRLLITNEATNQLVHRWRSEEAAIMVGTNTAAWDDPALTTRLWEGPSALRVVLDLNLRLPAALKLFDGQFPTVVMTYRKAIDQPNLRYVQLQEEQDLVTAVCDALHKLNIQSVLIEGGAQLLRSFIDARCWDEARVFRSSTVFAGMGLLAPELKHGELTETDEIQTDTLHIYKPTKF